MAFDKELSLIISGDSTKLKNALGEAGSQVTKFSEKIGDIGKKMTIVGGIVTGAFAMIVKKTADAGDQFDKMALRTGESVENLSSLGHACNITGTSIEGLETGIKFLTKGMDDASKGIGEGLKAFEELGISFLDTEGNLRPTIEVLKEAATKIAAIENPTKQAALAMQLFGSRSGTQLIPLLKEGGAGIETLMEQARQLNITISTESAKAAADFKDEIERLGASVAGAGRVIGDILIPSLTETAKKFVEVIKRTTEWAKEHPKLVEGITKTTAALGVAAAVGGPILIAAAAFSKIKGSMVAISTFSKATMIPAIGKLSMALTPLSIQLGLIAANVYIWKEVFSELNKVLKMSKVTAEDVTRANEALRKAQEKAAEKLGITVEQLIEFQKKGASVSEMMGLKLIPNTDDLTGSMDELGEGIETAKEKLNEFGQVIETFDEWVARLDEEAKKAAQKIADSAKEAFEKFADEMKSVEDRLFELTHTQREVELKQLDEKKAKLIEVAEQAGLSADKEIEAIKKIMDWYKNEIDLLNQKQVILAESRYKIYKEGKLIQSLGTVGGEQAQYLASQGYEVEEIPGWQPTQPGAFLPSYQVGISRVPRTGLALVHKDEEILTKEQRIYKEYKTDKEEVKVDNSIRIDKIIIEGDGDESKIRRLFDKLMEEKFTRQFGRAGYELPT